MKTRRPLVVTKRDGTLERFDPAKLRNVLAAAMQRRGYDPQLADPLTRAVALHLREWAGDRPPTTHYIHQCACAVLEQTELEDVAADLRWHRRQRALRRRAIEVVSDTDGTSVPWRKSVVARTLQDKYGLRQSVSRLLAGRIEQQVLGLGFRRMRKSLIAELVRCEVAAWGLSDQSRLAAPPPAELA